MGKKGLLKKHIGLTKEQIEFGEKKGSGNLSRYIRTLIDREIGRQEMKKLGGC